MKYDPFRRTNSLRWWLVKVDAKTGQIIERIKPVPSEEDGLSLISCLRWGAPPGVRYDVHVLGRTAAVA